MAQKIYRFRAKTDADLSSLDAEVGTPVSVAAFTGGKLADLQLEETFEDDVVHAMELRGYEYLGSDPVDPVVDDFLPQSTVPTAACAGEVLYSKDGSTFERSLPIVAHAGWLKNSKGIMVVK